MPLHNEKDKPKEFHSSYPIVYHGEKLFSIGNDLSLHRLFRSLVAVIVDKTLDTPCIKLVKLINIRPRSQCNSRIELRPRNNDQFPQSFSIGKIGKLLPERRARCGIGNRTPRCQFRFVKITRRTCVFVCIHFFYYVIPASEPGSSQKKLWIPGQARNDRRL